MSHIFFCLHTKLNELDVLHNMSLRMLSGAFTTSVENVCNATNKFPLNLRMEELGLQHITR